MEINYIQMLIDAIPAAAGIFVSAFQAQAWPFVVIAALAVWGLVSPTPKRRRRRA